VTGRRPLVAVTGPDRGGAAAWLFTWLAVWRAGGRARRVTPARPLPGGALDALVLGGGADVDPRLFGEETATLSEVLAGSKGSVEGGTLRRRLVYPLVWLGRRLLGTSRPRVGIDAARDRLELALLEDTLASGRPVLGICRGAQLLNVSFGGTLHRDLRDFYREAPRARTILARREVTVTPDSLLASLLGTTRCRVNALHHQAVAEVGEGLTVVAREPDGVVQAVEAPGRSFVLGVQWHPEYLPQIRRQRRIFEGLVEAASG
jgi:putative glutamine amidotransferase